MLRLGKGKGDAGLRRHDNLWSELTLPAPFGVVLGAFNKHGVQYYIVIGGQAVIAYGAAQFTRDADFRVNPTKTNLVRLRQVLKGLKTTLRFLTDTG